MVGYTELKGTYSSAVRKVNKTFVLASLLVSQLSMLSGFTHAFSAILIPQLQSPNSTITITTDEASWIASFGQVSRPFGALIQGLLVDKYGRKFCVQVAASVHAFSWLLIAVSGNVFMIYVARIINSLGTGMETASAMYIIEISPTSYRGTLISLMAPITNVGNLTVYILGYTLQWRLVAIVFATYSLFVLVALLMYAHESPIWYMIKNQRHQALESLNWLTENNKQEVNIEMEQLTVKYQNPSNEGFTDYMKKLMNKKVWKSFFLLVVFVILLKQAGQDVIVAYAVNFFSLFDIELNKALVSILFSLISLIGSLNVTLFAHKLNRLTILIFSGVGASIMLALAAVSLEYLMNGWLAVGFVFMYIYCYMSGMVVIPYMLIGEMFPSHSRGIMSAFVLMFMFTTAFVMTKLYPTMVYVLEPSGLLCYYSLFALLASVFAKLFLIETRNKTISELDDQFEK